MIKVHKPSTPAYYRFGDKQVRISRVMITFGDYIEYEVNYWDYESLKVLTVHETELEFKDEPANIGFIGK